MKRAFKLEGLDCANCAAKIEDAVRRIDGVTSASVNFLTTRMVIECDEASFGAIELAARTAVRRVLPDASMRKA